LDNQTINCPNKIYRNIESPLPEDILPHLLQQNVMNQILELTNVQLSKASKQTIEKIVQAFLIQLFGDNLKAKKDHQNKILKPNN
jgi:hypothetical protein